MSWTKNRKNEHSCKIKTINNHLEVFKINKIFKTIRKSKKALIEKRNLSKSIKNGVKKEINQKEPQMGTYQTK